MSGDSLMKDAEKNINKLFFKDYSAAQDLFEKAAARYKLDKEFSKSGEAYMKAGECAIKNKDTFAAAQFYGQASSAYKKCDLVKADGVLKVAVDMLIDCNRLSAAARLEKEFGDSLCEMGSSDAALTHYETAMKYFKAEDQNAQAQNCMIAMAKIYGENDQFEKALTLFERLGNIMVTGPLRFTAKDYFLKAMLCRFAMVNNDNRYEQSEECQEALANYIATDIHLKGTREDEFLQMTLEAVRECDIERFETAVSLLQELRMLDDWKTHILLVIKRNMESIA